MATANPPPNAVRISDLPAPQLSSLKKQIDDDLNTLTASHASLRAAVSKFKECARSIDGAFQPSRTERKEVLVPMTESLYVKGFLGPARQEEEEQTVLVDVGTGFYVEKSKAEGIAFYEERVKDVSAKVVEVEEAIRGKSEMSRVLEEELRERILAANAQSSGAEKP